MVCSSGNWNTNISQFDNIIIVSNMNSLQMSKLKNKWLSDLLTFRIWKLLKNRYRKKVYSQIFSWPLNVNWQRINIRSFSKFYDL
jgi:hypothetical protein